VGISTTFRAHKSAVATLVAGLVVVCTAGACPASTNEPSGDQSGRAAPGSQSATSSASRSTPSASGSGSPAATKRSVRRGWPTARNTGAKGHLRTRHGAVTITRDGTTLENKLIRGQITIRADDVTITNVRVESDAYYGILVYGRDARIARTTVVGTPGPTLAGIAAYEGGSFKARRINVSGTEDGVRLASHCSLRRSFVHGLAGSRDSHFDAVTADGYRDWRIVGNRILNGHDQTAAVWVGDPRYAPSAGVLRNNLIAGGGYSVYAGPGAGPGIRVIDNRFSTRYHARGGYWGPVTGWSRAHNTWSGNTWLNGPRKGRPVHP
jgi:hypothetical protein